MLSLPPIMGIPSVFTGKAPMVQYSPRPRNATARVQPSRLFRATSSQLQKGGFNMLAPNKFLGAPTDEPIDFRTLYYIVWEKRLIVLSLVGAGIVGAGVYLLRTPKVYAAET